METLEDVLAHYGIKGMKWGVRRSEKQLAKARKKRELSEDAEKAADAATKAKKKGVSSLSNKELQQLNQRLNLEQQYSRLTSKPSRLKKGQQTVKSILETGKTVNEAIAFANSPAGQELKKMMGSGAK